MREILANILVIRQDNKNVMVSFKNTEKFTSLNMNIIRQYLTRIIRKRGTILETDLSGIRFIDSTGFDTLTLIYRLGKKYGSTIILKGVEIEVLEMIELVKKYQVFDIRRIKPAC